MPSLDALQAVFQEWDSSRPQYLQDIHGEKDIWQQEGQSEGVV
jgi:hypothetical protein